MVSAEEKEEEDLEAIAAKEHKVFRYEMLVAATRNFNPKQKLGEGGFGPVFKVKCAKWIDNEEGRLADGREVAVKRLGRGSRQGAREFENEAMLLSRVQHKNVVNLYGYCVHADDKLLVYEYVPNESLDKLLFSSKHHSPPSSSCPASLGTTKVTIPECVTTHGRATVVHVRHLRQSVTQFVARSCSCVWPIMQAKERTQHSFGLQETRTQEEGDGNKMRVDWKLRYQVMVGVARGLLYLHEGAHTAIIHRDIKAGNILLDDRWVPKIADFGMARLFPEDQTHVNTRVAGTNGYMAPEYVMHGSLSTKADVFSFGVLVLELISGRKNSAFSPLPDPESDSLLEWV
ncbi:hypothetical protein BHE74_00039398 [Ensete ventricosum]|nr:hypothetical protein BHE74_00039398 [Ensete ventricosum]